MWNCSGHTGSSSCGRTFLPRLTSPSHTRAGRRNNTRHCRPQSQETPFSENPAGERSEVTLKSTVCKSMHVGQKLRRSGLTSGYVEMLNKALLKAIS